MVFRSKLIITTHGFYKFRYDNKMINLWHGIPIKSMGLMDKSVNKKSNTYNDDYFISTSEFYNTIMNSCLGMNNDKYYITGYPRNDYLFSENGRKNLKRLVEIEENSKVIFFMPTYRKGRNNLNNNILGFEHFNMDEFKKFLNKNNITFLFKLHPNEEVLLNESYYQYVNNRIILLKSQTLEEKKIDLYKIINSVDLLITDYSSIYFDYLLLDKPIIFTPIDLQEYRDTTGLLLEPYEFWTPGYKCLNQQDLQEKIIMELENPERHKKERDTIKNIVHKYQDGNSTIRVEKLIDEILNLDS